MGPALVLPEKQNSHTNNCIGSYTSAEHHSTALQLRFTHGVTAQFVIHWIVLCHWFGTQQHYIIYHNTKVSQRPA